MSCNDLPNLTFPVAVCEGVGEAEVTKVLACVALVTGLAVVVAK